MNIIELYKKSYSGVAKEIWLLAIISFINRAGSMVLPFLTIYLSTVKGYSLSLTGIIMMGYGIGSFFGNWLGGILNDRIGPFRLQFFSLLSSGLAYYTLLFLDTPISIAIGLFACTLLADSFRPANMASVAILAGQEGRVKAVGVSRLAFNLGFTAGPALGGFIAANFGYNWIFIIDGSTCILAALVFFYFFYPHIVAEGSKVVEEAAEGEEKPHLKQVLKDRPFMLFMLLLFVYGVIFMQYFNAVPVYLKNKMLLSEDYIGLMMALNGFLIVLIEMPIIQIIERKGLLRMMAFGTAMVGLAYLLYLPGQSIFLAWCATLLFTVGEVFSLPFATTVVLNRSTDKLRGRYMALYGMTFSLAHIVAPAFGMLVADTFGFTVLWALLGLGMFFTAFGYLKLKGDFERKEN